MNYEVIFDEAVIEKLGNFEKNLKKRIFEKIMQAKQDPEHFFKRLTERTDYKLRVGDYRIIADIDHTNKLIFITEVGHRKNIYK
jgi:mRNA interferase RelE/StbE